MLLSIFSISCNYTKHLQKNQILLNKNSLKLTTPKKIKYKGEFESSIMSLIAPQPNSRMFDLDFLPKYKLWKYNNRYQYYEKNDTDRKVVKHKVEKPVLLDSILIKKSEKNVAQYMLNQGYYNSTIETKINIENQKADVSYTINAGKSYYVNSVEFKVDNELLASDIREIQQNSMLKPGAIFNHFACGLERERIYKTLRNRGYYDFKTDNTIVIVDTSNTRNLKMLLEDPFENSVNYSEDTSSKDSMKVIVKIEQTKDSTYFLKYHIDSVIVTILSNEPNDELPYIMNELDKIHFRYQQLPINRKVLTRNIFIQEGAMFNLTDQEATINRLNQLNVFNNVNLKFEKQKDKLGRLICRINLTLNKKYEILGNTDLSTSTDGDYILGFGAAATFRDKNLFHGANQLLIRGAYSLQSRLVENISNNDTSSKLALSGNNLSISSTLIFPKFIVPFNQNKFSKKNIPTTQLSLNLSYINRIDNYKIFNVTGSYGYSWRETQQKNWTFTPSFLTLNIVPDTFLSNEFRVKIDSNNYLKSIFSSSIIYGENLVYQFRSKPKGLYNNYSSLRIGIEEAGAILHFFDKIYKPDTNNINNLAQYVKLDIDFRKYINFRKAQWANRILIGLGKPMRTSDELPYVKQYSVGGPASIRGWYARRLGPGRSSDSSFATSNSVIDQTGDMKFEINSEYRHNLLKLFSGVINIKGAVFADAGNIWLYKKNEDVLGGEFVPKYFLQDLAVSAGYGLRFDFSFFVFRVDLGFPIKNPAMNHKNGFDFEQLKFKNKVWNIAINYPF